MKKLGKIIVSILIPSAIGMLGWLLSGGIGEKYASLMKPPLSPEATVFPIVWSVLYVLMGIASYIVYSSDSPDKSGALKLYVELLAVNLLWPILFFGFGWLLPALICLMLLWLLAALAVSAFTRIKKSAGIIMLPYFAWCTFAIYLNMAIYIINK